MVPATLTRGTANQRLSAFFAWTMNSTDGQWCCAHDRAAMSGDTPRRAIKVVIGLSQ